MVFVPVTGRVYLAVMRFIQVELKTSKLTFEKIRGIESYLKDRCSGGDGGWGQGKFWKAINAVSGE